MSLDYVLRFDARLFDVVLRVCYLRLELWDVRAKHMVAMLSLARLDNLLYLA